MLTSYLKMCLLFLVAALAVKGLAPYPVPIPAGGRVDVHGWLILPFNQDKSNDSSVPLKAWFSHHVPEFWTDSPHNFQIILEGSLTLIGCFENDTSTFNLPFPPADSLLTYEYSFTPPSPFSLNDMLSGSLTKLNGVFYNGSFDTPYEREATALASLQIDKLTTAVYLDENENQPFEHLRYLSYPRGQSGESTHFYFSHEIRAQPDFDHFVHGTITKCTIDGQDMENTGVVSDPGTCSNILFVCRK